MCASCVSSSRPIDLPMTRKERYRAVIDWFKTNMPVAEPELHFSSPFQLLVAVILSAQCTDKRVNMITPALFKAFPTSLEMSQATPEAVLEYIHSVSYPNSKARHLVQMAQMLQRDYDGEVPCDFGSLLRLPGVGRKTANVVSAVAFGQATMAVDTHVFRVSHRLGLVSSRHSTPYAVEQELVKNIAEADRPRAHHWLLLHGRYICRSRKPACDDCGLQPFCLYRSHHALTPHSNSTSTAAS